MTAPRSAATIKPVRVAWLWEPYVPVGKLTAVCGQMDMGKSLLAFRLAASVSRSGRNVLVMSQEDDWADTVVPRLVAAGAALERIFPVADATLDCESLGRLCEEVGNVGLIIIDPLIGFLPGSVNSWKSQNVRRALDPLRRLAQDRRLAVLLVQHINRDKEATTALARVADSQAIPQLCRSVCFFGPDPREPDAERSKRRVLALGKGNLTGDRRAAEAFEIRLGEVGYDGLTAPYLHPLGTTTAHPDDIIGLGRDARTNEADTFLRDALSNGDRPASEVIEAAMAAKVTRYSVRQALDRLGGRSYRPGGNAGPYFWTLHRTQGFTESTESTAPNRGSLTTENPESTESTPPLDSVNNVNLASPLKESLSGVAAPAIEQRIAEDEEAAHPERTPGGPGEGGDAPGYGVTWCACADGYSGDGPTCEDCGGER